MFSDTNFILPFDDPVFDDLAKRGVEYVFKISGY
jgi:hypothetical protein